MQGADIVLEVFRLYDPVVRSATPPYLPPYSLLREASRDVLSSTCQIGGKFLQGPEGPALPNVTAMQFLMQFSWFQQLLFVTYVTDKS